MTAISAAPPASRAPESVRHIWAVVKLLFVNKVQVIYTPLATLGGVFLINLSIWWIIILASTGNATNHLGYSGAIGYIYIYSIIVAVQVILRTFPFSLGFGVTRRDFYLGATVAFVILAALFAAVQTIMSSIEIATHGWGIGGRMFAPVYFTDSSFVVRFFMAFLLILFCLFIGSVIATIYVRWRATGIVTFFVLLAVALVAAIAGIALGHQWPAVGRWFEQTGTFGIILWSLVPTAVAAVGGFLVIRGATPK